jgi:5-methylcytosine-specific restriction enzyme A
MQKKEKFINWLKNNTKLSSSTLEKYAGAINTISTELKKYQLLEGSLYNISDPLIIEAMIVKYLSVLEYREKDTRGNRMYSNALKYLKLFIEDSNKNKQIQDTLLKKENAIELNKLLDKTNSNSHSWTIPSPVEAIKELDRSAFLHHGTGIPHDIRFFFGADKMTKGERREVILEFDSKTFSARIEMDNQPSPRTRLFWKGDFEDVIQNKFPKLHQLLLSGKSIPDEVPELRFLKKTENSYIVCFIEDIDIGIITADLEAEDIENGELRVEGGLKTYFGKRFERDPYNRKRAIEIHGYSCVVCGFNYEEVYGERGKDFIEVHHVKPLNTLGGQEEIDPRTDLVPVCSNCHRIIHRRHEDVLSIDQMKELIRVKMDS